MGKWKTRTRFPTFPPHDSLSQKAQTQPGPFAPGNNPREATGKMIVAKTEKYLTPNTSPTNKTFCASYTGLSKRLLWRSVETAGIGEHHDLRTPLSPYQPAHGRRQPG